MTIATHARLEHNALHALMPDAIAAVTALNKAAADHGLEPALLELVKLRASQINGCAFCVQYHMLDARRLAMPEEQLQLLVAWREAPVFSARERAALAWTEALTLIAPDSARGGGVPDAVYEAARAEFSESELAYLTAAIGGINVWNRLAVAYRFTPLVQAVTGKNRA